MDIRLIVHLKYNYKNACGVAIINLMTTQRQLLLSTAATTTSSHVSAL